MSETNVIESSPFSTISLGGVLAIPAVRQLILLIGVAAAVAAGFAVVLWSQTPTYAQLYSGLGAAEAAQIAEALRGAGIRYQIDTDAGLVLVADSQLHDARIELASQGLAGTGSTGMDLLADQSSFGVSQFMESARYQTALQAELARTISHIGAVRSARVHLAIPRQSSFVRDRADSASASVLLELASGAELEPERAAAIARLVASSVPNMSAANVTVIDQFGRSLNESGERELMAQAGNQFRYTQQLEESYKRRVEDLLTPIVGPGRVRAEVVVNLDFTVTEETRESFDPAQTVVRSEQISEEETRELALAPQGIPGAASNQPPETGGVPADAPAAESEPLNVSRSSTRNFEVDRTISRTLPQPGRIERLSVALLIDDSAAPQAGADTAGAGASLDIDQITALAKEAVGFNEDRGDTFVLTQAPFQPLAQAPDAAEPGLLQNPMLIQIAKLTLGALVVLGLGFGLVRPMFKGLLATTEGAYLPAGGGTARLAASGMGRSQAQFAVPPPSFEEKVNAARNMTSQDPARVAQIVRKWVGDNG